jgi:DNA replication and repair protein RecF
VYFSSLKLTGFKNYETLHLTFSPRLNCFTGLNGTGKTNILDALYYLCLCKSHSGLPDKNIVQHGGSFFRIEGQISLPKGATNKVVAKYALGQRKVMEQNGTEAERLADYVGRYPVVMIAPDDVALVQEGSEDRRRFLDNTLSQLSSVYLHQLMLYNGLLKQRNALLRQFAEERRFDAALLDAYNQQMYAPAALIFQQRRDFCLRISPVFTELYAEISGAREQAALTYASELDAQSMEMLLMQNAEKDRLLQRTSAGPHRDDLILLMDGLPVKKFASQGQLKSFLLALRLAQYETMRLEKGVNPFLLLDDIFDKLDEHRVRYLVHLLLQRQFGQIFITDTQRARLEPIVQNLTNDYFLFETK